MERVHERVMHGRGTRKMCTERMRGREHEKSVKKGCVPGAIKRSSGKALTNRTRNEVFRKSDLKGFDRRK